MLIDHGTVTQALLPRRISNLINGHNYLSPFGHTPLPGQAYDQTHQMIDAELPRINTHHRSTRVNGKYMRLPIDLEKPARSYRKVFLRNSNNTHWIGNLMTVEITKGRASQERQARLLLVLDLEEKLQR
jgi:hypothetical protein